MNTKKIAFIGVGNMAGAILKASMNQGYLDAEDIIMFDHYPPQYEKYNKDGISIKTAESVYEAAENADFILLGVKPQSDISGILGEISKLDLSQKVIISIITGVKIETLEKYIGKPAKIIRTMPNTPLLVGKGVTALCRNANVSDDEFSFAEGLFKSGGTAVILNEDEINLVTAVTSSSVAYFALFVKAIADASAKMGFEPDNLNQIICETAMGSLQLMYDMNMTPEALIKMVATPNGTTEKALNVFNEKNLFDIVFDAMDACVKRADELSATISRQ